MRKKDEALKLALEALEFIPQSGSMLGSQAETKRLQAIAVMKEALTEQPASKPWVGLTDEDLAGCDDEELKQARYWEAKLREKNA